jgi:two-component system, chemotaxis family, CheB/CheR fusion protein
VAPDHIYVIPPGKDLAMRGETLSLRDRGERSQHAPVDLFFRTLAEVYGPEAVGVVLSGTGEDGTAGIHHIRDAGGITVAQLPAESEYDGMPASAIATGLVDLVLPAGGCRLSWYALAGGQPAGSTRPRRSWRRRWPGSSPR